MSKRSTGEREHDRTDVVSCGVLLAVLLTCVSCLRESSEPASISQSSGVIADSSAASQSTVVPFISTPLELSPPLGLPNLHVRTDNPLTAEKVSLGRQLFFDKLLSVDQSMSCATCHDPEQGWSNGSRVAKGANGQLGTRNVPTIVNVAFYRSLFWDGRAGSLETQALGPILNKDEMGIPSTQVLLDRLLGHDEYPALFAKAFSNGLTATNVARAIASYERTILAGNSPYDRFVAGDKTAMSEAALRGMKLFLDKRKSKCVSCHEPPTFSTFFYHNLGVGMDQDTPDLGRFEVTKLLSNKGKFKVPTVRDVKDTAPYMHDGSIATLEEVVELYDRGGIPNPYLSDEMRGRLNLTAQEKADLVTFMVEGLSSDDRPAP